MGPKKKNSKLKNITLQMKKTKKTLKKTSINVKMKTVNHIMRKGKKKTGEKLLIKSVKEIQKKSNKPHKEIIQLAVMNATPLFKISERRLKKKRKSLRQVPFFLANRVIRTSTSIRNIILKVKKLKSNETFYENFSKEIILSAQNKSEVIKNKNNAQKLALEQKKYLDNYKWRGRVKPKSHSFKKTTSNRT